jgi:hypothetical protein
MGDVQLYGNLALGEYRTFKQRSLNLLSISTAKELGIEMPPELVAGAQAQGLHEHRDGIRRPPAPLPARSLRHAGSGSGTAPNASATLPAASINHLTHSLTG